jgi:DNA-damage-inducible protein J
MTFGPYLKREDFFQEFMDQSERALNDNPERTNTCKALAKQISDTTLRAGGILMANKENLTLRIDPELKKEASALFKSLGLDLSTATGIFYRQALRKKGLPFDVVLEEPNKATRKTMREASKGQNMVGPFDTVDDLMEDLNAKD